MGWHDQTVYPTATKHRELLRAWPQGSRATERELAAAMGVTPRRVQRWLMALDKRGAVRWIDHGVWELTAAGWAAKGGV